MKEWVRYIAEHTTTPNLWTGCEHYGDWLGLDAPEGSYKGSSDQDLIASAYYAYSTSIVAKAGRLLGKYLLPLADGCIFQTEQAKHWFPERLQNKSRVIPNAVKPVFFEVDPQPVPGRVITCGRLHPQKNHKLLIDAFLDAAADIPEAELLIYGEGELRQEMEAYIAEKCEAQRVKLMGNTSDVPGVLANAACFVLSSDYEGMPNALMEAMAAGVPCISTDCPCGGPEMLIENGKSGLLVPVGDRDALTAAIRKVLTDAEAAQQLGKEARSAAENFLPEKIFAQWRQYLLDCCK